MTDILLNTDGDLAITPTGDISLTDSVRQAVLVRLRWIYGEWRLGPDLGFPWFEEVLVKNPNTVKIRSLIRDEILKVEGVEDAKVTNVKYDPAKRAATFYFTCAINGETYNEEVTLYG